MEGLDRESRGSVDRQTTQSHPIIGTPCDVPVPRNSTRTEGPWYNSSTGHPDMPKRRSPLAPRTARPARRPSGPAAVPRQTGRSTEVSRRARRAGTRLARLVQIMADLRAPSGCPWDRAQTHASLGPFLLEEAYEAVDAIDRGDLDELAGELGDVLLQCVFHSQLAAEAGAFDLADAIDAISAKLIRRHPHVFTPAGRPLAAGSGRRDAGTPDAVVERWAQIKARERGETDEPPRVLAGVPRAMPALLRAHEIGTRVAAVGFDWPSAGDVADKIEEEVAELRAALGESRARAAEELGDLLFSIANLARKLDLEPESALRAANDKFTRRFDAVEARLAAEGRSVHDATTEDLEAAWQAIKKEAGGAAAAAPPATARRRRRDGDRSSS